MRPQAGARRAVKKGAGTWEGCGLVSAPKLCGVRSLRPEQFSDEEVEPPELEEGEPAAQCQDPAPAQEGEDEGVSAGQGEGKGRRMPAG
ncbi:hypothetical protein H8959_000343, partial [Pygathrix nigripes]